ncbi:MAG: hypothetical protein ACD_72C00262G0003 [uncultured bacterium]|nr:MAG: hypothetical protein ACD_72C00262G0003 [uncultured bacterium]
MILIPAIDIINGQCVRLSQGDYDQKTVYQDDPMTVAMKFEKEGAVMLSLIDLDGAKSGSPCVRSLILDITKKLSIPVQVGGGIRTIEDAEFYLQNGVERILLGTIALENPVAVSSLIEKFGSSRIVATVEIKQNKLAVNGWKNTSDVSLEDYLISLNKLGVKIVLVTDTQKDGTFLGPNLGLIKKVVDANFEVLAAGGVASLDDLEAIGKTKAMGAIIGKALYEGRISFQDAIKKFNGQNNLTKRIIPCLDVAGGRVVKGTNFQNLIDAGDAVEVAKFYCDSGADELVFLDITASKENRSTALDLVAKVAANINIPFTVGGGINSIEVIKELLNVGADKVAINSAAILNSGLITEASKMFGVQCIVVSIDAKKKGNSWELYIKGGSEATGIDAIDFARQMQILGAGELLVNSLDKDGTKSGYDVELLKAVAKAVTIPVIASSGAGKKEDFLEVFQKTKVDAVLAASLFHYGDMSIGELKKYLKSNNINIRI